MADLSFIYTRNVRLPLALGNSVISSSYTGTVTVTLTATDLTMLQDAYFITDSVNNTVSSWSDSIGQYRVSGPVADVNTILSKLSFYPSTNGTWYNLIFDAVATDSSAGSIFNSQWSFNGTFNASMRVDTPAPTRTRLVSNNFVPDTNNVIDLGDIAGPLPIYDYYLNLADANQFEADLTTIGSLYNDTVVGNHSLVTANFQRTSGNPLVWLSKNGKHLVSASSTTQLQKMTFNNGQWTVTGNAVLSGGTVSAPADVEGRVSEDGNYLATATGGLIKFNWTAGTATKASTTLTITNPSIQYTDIAMRRTSAGTNTAHFEVYRGSGSSWSLSHFTDMAFTGTLTQTNYSLNGATAFSLASNGDMIQLKANLTDTTFAQSTLFNDTTPVSFQVAPNDDSMALLDSTTTVRVRELNSGTWGSSATVVTTTNILQYGFLSDRNRVFVLTGTASPYTLSIYGKNLTTGVWTLIKASSIALTGTASAIRVYGGVANDLVRSYHSGGSIVDRYYTNSPVMTTSAPVPVINGFNTSMVYKKIDAGQVTFVKVRVFDNASNEIKYAVSLNKTTQEINSLPAPLVIASIDALVTRIKNVQATNAPAVAQAVTAYVGPVKLIQATSAPLNAVETTAVPFHIDTVVFDAQAEAFDTCVYVTATY